MKSKANIKSHPLHPIMVTFPIAFFIGTMIFDLLFVATGNDYMAITARYINIAGIAGAILAAIPGIIDYIYTVPPQSSAKKRATKHALINSVVLILFIAILLFRHTDLSRTLICLLDISGVIMLSIAGWMGGTLVHRNQIGIDMRYAHAGKWKEEYVTEQDGKAMAAIKDELKPNQMKLIHVGGKRIVIGRTEDSYVAFDDFCTHRGGSLAGGSMICGTVQCPWHGSQFDVKTGRVKAGPATRSIKTYDIYETGNNVFVMLR